MYVFVKAPEEYTSNRTTLDLAIYYIDFIVNMGFMVIKALTLIAIPMNIRIDNAFGKRVDKLSYLIRDDSVYVMILVVLSLYFGFAPIGLGCRLVRMVILTPAVLLAFPRLSILLSSITKAINSIAVTIGLFFYIMLTYTAFGHLLFNINDPYHFGTYCLSMWSFFHFALFDTWSELWYINYYGCDAVPTELTMDLNHVKNYNLHTPYGHFKYNTCENPTPYPVASTLVFLSYTFICGYVGVNMILAAVVIGVKNGLDEYKHMDHGGEEDAGEEAGDGSQDKGLSNTASLSPEGSSAVLVDTSGASSYNPSVPASYNQSGGSHNPSGGSHPSSYNGNGSTYNGTGASFNSYNGGARAKRTSVLKRDNKMSKMIEQKIEHDKWNQLLESIWAGVTLSTSKSYVELVEHSGPWYSPKRMMVEVERWLGSPIHGFLYTTLAICSAFSEVCAFF